MGFMSEAQTRFFDSLNGKPVGFIMPIQDTFTMPGRATVVTGTIVTGSVRLTDIVEVITRDGSRFYVKITGLEKNKKLLDTAVKGDQVGVLLPLHHSGVINVGDVMFIACE